MYATSVHVAKEAETSRRKWHEEKVGPSGKPGMWFESLFMIFINVFKIDIIYIILNFRDIIHYFCQIQTLFIFIRHHLSQLVQNWDRMG